MQIKETKGQPDIKVLKDKAQWMLYTIKFFLVQQQNKEVVPTILKLCRSQGLVRDFSSALLVCQSCWGSDSWGQCQNLPVSLLLSTLQFLWHLWHFFECKVCSTASALNPTRPTWERWSLISSWFWFLRIFVASCSHVRNGLWIKLSFLLLAVSQCLCTGLQFTSIPLELTEILQNLFPLPCKTNSAVLLRGEQPFLHYSSLISSC